MYVQDSLHRISSSWPCWKGGRLFLVAPERFVCFGKIICSVIFLAVLTGLGPFAHPIRHAMLGGFNRSKKSEEHRGDARVFVDILITQFCSM